MSARCLTCGETLLGAVNRCWKCGAEAHVSATIVEKQPDNSPFAPVDRSAEATATDHEHLSFVQGSAYASLSIGLFALLLSWSLPYAVVPGIIGLGCGIWSFSQRRNRVAAVGILICLLAIYWSGILTYRTMLDWHELNYPTDAF